jgi:hypothetical protein
MSPKFLIDLKLHGEFSLPKLCPTYRIILRIKLDEGYEPLENCKALHISPHGE